MRRERSRRAPPSGRPGSSSRRPRISGFRREWGSRTRRSRHRTGSSSSPTSSGGYRGRAGSTRGSTMNLRLGLRGLDISMPNRNGLEILPELRMVRPQLKVLVLTMYVDRILPDTALSLGANGFVPKDCGIDELCTAIEEVLAGHTQDRKSTRLNSSHGYIS